VVQSCHLQCTALKIRPKNPKYSDSLNTHTEFPFYNQGTIFIGKGSLGGQERGIRRKKREGHLGFD